MSISYSSSIFVLSLILSSIEYAHDLLENWDKVCFVKIFTIILLFKKKSKIIFILNMVTYTYAIVCGKLNFYRIKV